MLKNLIFDVGGVLIDYRWQDMLKDYGITKERAFEVGMAVFEDPIWKQFDSGLISLEEMKEHYHKTYPKLQTEIDYFLDHAELMRVDLPDVWERVEKLHKKYRIYLLSNYSKVLFEKHTTGATFLNELDGEIISYQVKMIKPDPGIYKALLEKYDLNAEESIFFDDRKENVEAAEKLGITGFHVESTIKLLEKLDSLL